MRAQNQLSFSDWQNLILFTQKNSSKKFSGGSFRQAVAVLASGAVSSERQRWWSAAVNGGGNNSQWCKVVVVVNEEKIRKIESCSNQGSPKKQNCNNEGCQGKYYSNEGCQGKYYSNEGCQGKWLQQWRLLKRNKNCRSRVSQIRSSDTKLKEIDEIYLWDVLQMWLQSLFINWFTT